MEEATLCYLLNFNQLFLSPVSCHSSPAHRSRTRKRNCSSTTTCSTSTPASTPASPPSSTSALQLHHVHHQLLHVWRRLPEPTVHDEDRRPHLRSYAAQLRTPNTTISPTCLSTTCSPTSRPTSSSSVQLSTTQLGTLISAARVQQLPSTPTPTYATWPCTPSGDRSSTCWVPSSTSCARTITGAVAPSTWHASEPWWVDEMRV